MLFQDESLIEGFNRVLAEKYQEVLTNNNIQVVIGTTNEYHKLIAVGSLDRG